MILVSRILLRRRASRTSRRENIDVTAMIGGAGELFGRHVAASKTILLLRDHAARLIIGALRRFGQTEVSSLAPKLPIMMLPGLISRWTSA